LKIRYGTTPAGKNRPVAKIYSKQEHNIDVKRIDQDAFNVVKRLVSHGYQTYIVGGAVRDLLFDRYPKDFDIVTEAVPREIKKLFRNGRIIGRRFRLVHVHFSEKILEVSTFRAQNNGDEEGNNVYGTIEEDVHRRDFSFNALYYDPIQEELIDFVDGYADLQKRRMRSLIPLNSTFIEDPVRMIRAVKYAEQLNIRMSFFLRRAIKKYAPELERCPPSRLTEEMFKIIESGQSARIIRAMIDCNLFKRFLPVIDAHIRNQRRNERQEFFASLERMDRRVQEKGENRRGRLIAALVEGVCIFPDEWENTTFLFQDMFKEVKRLIEPLTPPNQEVEMAVVWLFREEGLQPPAHVCKKRRPHPSGQKRRSKHVQRHHARRQ
jgi:poly(A) polymerase